MNNRSVAIDIPLFFARVAFFIGPLFPFSLSLSLSRFSFFLYFCIARRGTLSRLSSANHHQPAAAGLIGARRAL
jgi:hypothetical protein